MSLLARPLQLQDVRDVEALCVAIVQESGLDLTFHDEEDLVAYLVSTAWEISRKHEGTGKPLYLRGLLRRRVVDWQRARFGRTRWQFAGRVYERERPQPISLDAPDSNDHRLEDTLASVQGNPPTDSSSALRRVLDERSSARSRDLVSLGLDPPRRTP